MIAADKDRNGAGPREIIGARADGPDPALDFPVVPGVVRRRVIERGNAVNGQVAVVFDGKIEPFEQGQKTCGSERIRPHQRSALRRTNFDRRAEHGDLFLLL